MKAILVRVGIDATAGGWNGPVDTRTGEFVLVPIPEVKQDLRRGLERYYDELTPRLREFGSDRPDHLEGRIMHLDPDFEHLTYGDKYQRGEQLRTLKRGDIIVFYAGLRSLCSSDTQLVYALVGMFVVDEVLPAKQVVRAHWPENAHTRRIPDAHDLVVRAIPGKSGRLEKCIPVGEYRNRAYRVRRDVLKAWGGLSVRDGYIQRSARLPHLCDPGLFCSWLSDQKVQLLRKSW